METEQNKRTMPDEVRQRIKEAFAGVDRRRLVIGLSASENYVSQVVLGHVRVSGKRAKAIATIMNQPKLAAVLRPDIFG